MLRSEFGSRAERPSIALEDDDSRCQALMKPGKIFREFVDHRRCHRVGCIRTIQRENLDVFPGLHGDGRVFFHAVSHHFVVDGCPEVALSSTSFQPYPSNRAMRKD